MFFFSLLGSGLPAQRLLLRHSSESSSEDVPRVFETKSRDTPDTYRWMAKELKIRDADL